MLGFPFSRAISSASSRSLAANRPAALHRVGLRAFAAKPPAPTGNAASGKLSALAAAIRQIESNFGKGAVMQLGSSNPLAQNVEVISTGSLTVDHALGVGGLPRGRVVEIYGPESSGKTTLALHVIAQAQKQGLTCCFIDAEHALDPSYAKAVGVDLESLYLAQPDTGEQALEIADTLTRSGAIDGCIVVDSVAALVPKAELEGEMGDAHMALQARLMSQALRKLTASLSGGGGASGSAGGAGGHKKSPTLLIFLNQIRSKVGVIFGSPDVTPGGNALRFYSSVRLEIRRTGQVKKPGSEHVVGSLTRVKVAKNKLAPPFRTADFEMSYGFGISRAGEALDLGSTGGVGVFGKSGAWYSVLDPAVLLEVRKAMAEDERKEKELVSGGNETPAAPAAPAAAEPAPAATAAAAKKGSKKAAAPTATAATTPAAAAAAASATANLPALAPGEAFLQGRERMKGFLEEHPAVLEAAIKAVKRALKENPNALEQQAPTKKGAAAAAAAAAAPSSSNSSSTSSSTSTSSPMGTTFLSGGLDNLSDGGSGIRVPVPASYSSALPADDDDIDGEGGADLGAED